MENELITPYLSQLKNTHFYRLMKKTCRFYRKWRYEGTQPFGTIKPTIGNIHRKYLHYKVSLSDLLQEGNIGLLIAATNFVVALIRVFLPMRIYGYSNTCFDSYEIKSCDQIPIEKKLKFVEYGRVRSFTPAFREKTKCW